MGVVPVAGPQSHHRPAVLGCGTVHVDTSIGLSRMAALNTWQAAQLQRRCCIIFDT